MSRASDYYIDTHCHFDFDAFDIDRTALWTRCQQLDIRHLIIPGVDPCDMSKVVTLCEELPGVFFAAGLHPWWIERSSQDELQVVASLKAQISNSKCVALGECGLDKSIDVPMVKQVNWFERQLKLAQQFSLPIIIHNHKANNLILQSIDKHPLKYGGVLHGFSGSTEFGMQLHRRGLLLGIGGTITYPRAKKTRAAVANLPLECLVLETDAPDMPLYGKQGLRNSPTYLVEIASCVAELKCMPLDKVIQQTTENAQRLFGLR